MTQVVGVRFKPAGKVYFFDPGDLKLIENDNVIVETIRGIEFGQVVNGPREVPDEQIVHPLKQVIREATQEDKKIIKENKEQEQEAFNICVEKIVQHNLPMKLVSVEKTFDGNKIIFYFTAEGRVDFRDLVKDLASIFRTRIELRQIGVRDEAKMLGGLGCCGRELCCCSWLSDFNSVSIRMAKDQNLSLNPSKISGICGRLMCCLKFESEVYEEAKEKFPKIDTKVMTPDGVGKVCNVNIFKQTIQVELTSSEIIKEYFLKDISTQDEEVSNEHGAPSSDNNEHGNQGEQYDNRSKKDEESY
ncbi:MAG: stage 0 sporulation family protein [Clostridiales bacterium]|nr:stage 0 sporulation family protein [Clostridiales bacterium]MCF8021539.1 stage 0 sporulation family protein [Clostridiales bacterium]